MSPYTTHCALPTLQWQCEPRELTITYVRCSMNLISVRLSTRWALLRPWWRCGPCFWSKVKVGRRYEQASCQPSGVGGWKIAWPEYSLFVNEVAYKTSETRVICKTSYRRRTDLQATMTSIRTVVCQASCNTTQCGMWNSQTVRRCYELVADRRRLKCTCERVGRQCQAYL